jgi:hypothetical protein
MVRWGTLTGIFTIRKLVLLSLVWYRTPVSEHGLPSVGLVFVIPLRPVNKKVGYAADVHVEISRQIRGQLPSRPFLFNPIVTQNML